jgi:hypothetical protein
VTSDLKTLEANYQVEFDIKKTLEEKANNITTISGVVATLLFGFGQLFVSKLAELHYPWLPYVTFIVMFGCLTGLAAIVFSVAAFRVEKYHYVIGGKSKPRPSITTDISHTEFEIREKDEDLIQAYIDSINENEKKNNSKSNWVLAAQSAFILSIFSIVILLGWLLYSPITFPK